MGNRIKKPTWEDVRNKRFMLLGMGSELVKIADKQSEKYKQLKNRYEKLEADIQEMISYLDGTYKAKKLTEDAKKVKDERDKAISRKGTKSKELEEKLEKLEIKREEEIQKINDLRGKINRINLSSEDKDYDEVSKKAEEWKIQNEMVKRSLKLRTINAKIGMTKIRKSNQDAKDIENIRKVIDSYNEKITEYKKQMDELNDKRPKSIPEEFMRENDWILGAVTIDKNKRLQEVIDKIDEENRELRQLGQEKYFKKSQKEDPKLPYKELNDKERNELITYSEEMTTFEQLTEFIKIKAARAAGKVVGLTILAARKIKSIFKPKEENKASKPVEEAQSNTGSTFTDECRDAIQEKANEINLQEPVEEVIVEKTEPVEEPVEEVIEDPLQELMQKVVNNQLEQLNAESTMEELDTKDSPKSEVRRVEKSDEMAKAPVKVNPFKLRVAVSKDVKKAVEAVPTTQRKEPTEIEREIDTNTFE